MRWPVLLIGLTLGFQFNDWTGGKPAMADETDLGKLLNQFQSYSGAQLVFHRDDLPEGRYHDVLKPLDAAQRIKAAKVCLEEAKLYPPNFFGEVGLDTIGVFAACASKTTTDKSRPFDRGLGGYRYFGVYNGTNAIAAAFYSDGQLALTFHHEIFHHVDSTVDGVTESWQLSSDDAFYQAAISGKIPHKAPPIDGDDLVALRERCIGFTLKDAVSAYAAKNSREDQAETARHVMSMLPNSLVQAIDQPELAGSQRILHVLNEYEHAVPDGPSFDWFVDVALDRASRDRVPSSVDVLIDRMTRYVDPGDSGFNGISKNRKEARTALRMVVRIDPNSISPEQGEEFVKLAAELTSLLIRNRIRPDAQQMRFNIWGQEDSNGINHTLRHDVKQFARDAKRMGLIVKTFSLHAEPLQEQISTIAFDNARLLARYCRFIKSNWTMTSATQQTFVDAKNVMAKSLPEWERDLGNQLTNAKLSELADLQR